MRLLVSDLVEKINKIFDDTKVLSVNTVYEKTDNSDELKLVIFLNKIFYDDVNIIYTKFIFITNIEKSLVTKSYFTYLYDINCKYMRVNFDDFEDMGNKIDDIFNSGEFGDNLKILSKFIKSPAFLVNEWFSDNDVNNLSVVGLRYEPKVNIVPCKSLFFSFIIDMNDNIEIELDISKEKDEIFIFKFKIMDKYITVEQENLNNLVQVVGETLKNNIK